MTDTERMTELMRVKNLNNVQFSQLTGISTATLSHITSGRTNPSLAILRNVVTAFPDINPEWIFMGQGEMFLEDVDPELVGSPISTASPSLDDHAEQPVPAGISGFSPAAISAEALPRPRRQAAYAQPELFSSSSQVGTVPGQGESCGVSLSDIMNELRKNEKRPVRKITEIRIFFDDGTYESFGKS